MLMEDTIQRWTACVDARAIETCRLDSMDGWFLLGIFLASCSRSTRAERF